MIATSCWALEFSAEGPASVAYEQARALIAGAATPCSLHRFADRSRSRELLAGSFADPELAERVRAGVAALGTPLDPLPLPLLAELARRDQALRLAGPSGQG